jgi:hypothetical protein
VSLANLHIALAILTTATVLLATIEGAIRAIRKVPAGDAAFRSLVAVLISVVLTVGAGIALIVSGERPKEWLHLLYAALAFGLIPFADNASSSLRSNRMKGLYRFGGGVVCLLILTRLFVTGKN